MILSSGHAFVHIICRSVEYICDINKYFTYFLYDSVHQCHMHRITVILKLIVTSIVNRITLHTFVLLHLQIHKPFAQSHDGSEHGKK